MSEVDIHAWHTVQLSTSSLCCPLSLCHKNFIKLHIWGPALTLHNISKQELVYCNSMLQLLITILAHVQSEFELRMLFTWGPRLKTPNFLCLAGHMLSLWMSVCACTVYMHVCVHVYRLAETLSPVDGQSWLEPIFLSSPQSVQSMLHNHP